MDRGPPKRPRRAGGAVRRTARSAEEEAVGAVLRDPSRAGLQSIRPRDRRHDRRFARVTTARASRTGGVRRGTTRRVADAGSPGTARRSASSSQSAVAAGSDGRHGAQAEEAKNPAPRGPPGTPVRSANPASPEARLHEGRPRADHARHSRRFRDRRRRVRSRTGRQTARTRPSEGEPRAAAPAWPAQRGYEAEAAAVGRETTRPPCAARRPSRRGSGRCRVVCARSRGSRCRPDGAREPPRAG